MKSEIDKKPVHYSVLPEVRKKKLILALSDIPLAATGVAVQFNQLITQMINTGEYAFYVVGGAVQHPDMEIKKLNDDFILEPCVGQGNKEVVRRLLAELQPDALFIFTDPHQYMYLWEMSDEVHQVCPILYWHVWDNDPYPDCNTIWYKSTDFIGTISLLTHNLVASKFPERTKYIPHTFSKYLYFPLPDYSRQRAAEFFYRDKAEWFKILWVNRNGHRKQCLELLESFKMFLTDLQEKEGHQKAVLLLRTEPKDPEGPDLLVNIERLGLEKNIIVIQEKLEYSLMNTLYNSADLVVNNSKAEGFGLSLLTAMNTKTMMAGVMTGGMKEQLVHPITGEEFGFPIPVSQRNLVGSQIVPYIYEDYSSRVDIKEIMMKAFKTSPEERKRMTDAAYNHAQDWFGFEKVMNLWKTSFDEQIKLFKEERLGKNQWSIDLISTAPEKEAMIAQAQFASFEAQRQAATQKQAENKNEMIEEALAKLKAQQAARQGTKK
jgi:glycosyltransferase involved in cell wall biosynthesis